MTLKSTSWPRLSFSLKNSCSGYVRAMSLRISFSQGDVIFSSSEYWSFMGRFWALQRSCHTIARKWCGMPFLTSSCTEVWPKDSYITMAKAKQQLKVFVNKKQLSTEVKDGRMVGWPPHMSWFRTIFIPCQGTRETNVTLKYIYKQNTNWHLEKHLQHWKDLECFFFYLKCINSLKQVEQLA